MFWAPKGVARRWTGQSQSRGRHGDDSIEVTGERLQPSRRSASLDRVNRHLAERAAEERRGERLNRILLSPDRCLNRIDRGEPLVKFSSDAALYGDVRHTDPKLL